MALTAAGVPLLPLLLPLLLLLLSGSVHLSHAKEDQCEGRGPGPVPVGGNPNLQVKVNRDGLLISSSARLQCVSQCCLPSNPSYIWYRNGHKVKEQQSSSYRDIFDQLDSVYCAVKGLEDFPSPQTCVRMNPCNTMTYTAQKIIAVNGSTVDISCTYSGGAYGGLNFWFRPDRSHLWRNVSIPRDLSKDPQYAGRVTTSVKTGRFTLRITNLTEGDSAQYRFHIYPGYATLPGTTLSVTALQVQVSRITTTLNVSEVELRCQSSCSPAAPLSYVWFKNGQRRSTENSSTYTDQFQPGDHVSCALTGYEDYRSPSVVPYRRPTVCVSVSPSGPIVEGSSVTLSCSCDAEAAADYTWHKEDGGAPLASGPNFTITHVTPEDSGTYYCQVQDDTGRYKSVVRLSVVTKDLTVVIMNVTRLTLLGLLLLSVLVVNLWTRSRKKKEKTQRFTAEPTQFVEMRER